MRRTPFFLSVCLLSTAWAQTPATQPPAQPLRPAPDFTLQFVDGDQKQLSSYRGKVVALEFLYTTCPHCQHASQVFSKLYEEFGSRGFQPIGVAINDMSRMLVQEFINTYHVNYPVAFSDRDKALEFLQFSVMERFVVPQVVWIDRKGMIRSETTQTGTDESMLKEEYWRTMLDKLLSENAGPAKHPATHHTASR